MTEAKKLQKQESSGSIDRSQEATAARVFWFQRQGTRSYSSKSLLVPAAGKKKLQQQRVFWFQRQGQKATQAEKSLLVSAAGNKKLQQQKSSGSSGRREEATGAFLF